MKVKTKYSIIIFQLTYYLIFNHVYSQTFEKVFTEITSNNSGSSIVQNDDGGYTFVGKVQTTSDRDLMIVRTNQLGDTIWVKVISNAGFSEGLSIKPTTDEGYIVSGWNNPDLTYPNIYLLKTNINGDTIWTRTYTEYEIEWGISAYELESDSGYIVCGQIQTTPYGGIKLIRTNKTGETIWSNVIILDSLNKIKPEGFRVTYDNGYIICGQATPLSNPDKRTVFTIKTDALGNVDWKKNYSWDDYSIGYDIEETYDLGFIICGVYQESIGMPTNILLIRIDQNGDTIWTHQMESPLSTEVAYSVKECNDNCFILCGYIQNSSTYQADVYLLKTDQNGDTIWSRKFGQLYDSGFDVIETDDNGYAVIGSSNEISSGQNKSFLIKTDNEGLITLIECYDQERNQIQIFPNPNSGEFSISSKDPLEKIELYNLQLQLIHTFDIEEKNVLFRHFSINNLKEDAYIIKVYSNMSWSVNKLIIIGK